MIPGLVNTNPNFTNGGTSFDPPFDKAADLAQKYINSSIVLFIFMTDGEAQYPVSGIQRLKAIQANNPTRLKYAGI